MSKINTVHKIDVSTASFPYSLLLASRVSRYKIYGTKALAVNIAINPSGTPKEGMSVKIDYSATVTTTTAVSRFGDYSLSIFGTAIPYSLLAVKLRIECEYINSAWQVYIKQSADVIPYIKLEALDPAIVDDTTLSVDVTTGKLKVKPLGIAAVSLATDAVEEAKIKGKAVTLAKMADLARGSIIVGGASDAPTALAAKTSGYLLIGDGTDVVAVPVSGDVTIAADGTVTIGNDKIFSAMVKAGELLGTHLSAAAAVAFTQMEALTASKIPVLNASGFIEASVYDTAKLAYTNVTTPGTLELSKAVVVDGSGKIDTLDITAPKINGTTLSATASELNYSSGVTSNIQTQINAVAAKETNTIIVVDTVATAATLYQVYTLSTTAGAVNLTLPLASTVEDNTTVTVIQKGANLGTLVVNVADTLNDSLGVDVPSLACSGNGGWIKVVKEGATTWTVVMVS